jgi:hypothetical protein
VTTYAIRLPDGHLITDPDWHSVADVMRGAHAFDVEQMPGELIEIEEEP